MISNKNKEKLKHLWAWLRKNVINKDMLWAFLIAEIIFWAPCVIFVILAVTINPWFWTAFTAIVIFWTAPLTPGWALQIALALFIKKRIDRFHEKYIRVDKANKQNKENNDEKIEP